MKISSKMLKIQNRRYKFYRWISISLLTIPTFLGMCLIIMDITTSLLPIIIVILACLLDVIYFQPKTYKEKLNLKSLQDIITLHRYITRQYGSYNQK